VFDNPYRAREADQFGFYNIERYSHSCDAGGTNTTESDADFLREVIDDRDIPCIDIDRFCNINLKQSLRFLNGDIALCERRKAVEAEARAAPDVPAAAVDESRGGRAHMRMGENFAQTRETPLIRGPSELSDWEHIDDLRMRELRGMPCERPIECVLELEAIESAYAPLVRAQTTDTAPG
jgi:hypothetical protein